jgi:hypothetical protein
MRLREPPELDFPPEKPSTVQSMIRLHVEALGYGLEELAALLHMHTQELPAFHGLPARKGGGDAAHLRIVR